MSKEKPKSRKPQREQEDKRTKMHLGRQDNRDLRLSPEDARSGSPADVSVGGEEDAGVGLEFVVRKDER